MSDSMLKSKINSKIQQLDVDENSIIVLKGIPMSVVDSSESEQVDIQKASSNRLMYFMNIYGKRKYITYEEFLLLGNFIVDQYAAVYVINNNIYMEQYPLDLRCSDETQKGLLVHFMDVDDDTQDDEVIGDIGDIAELYNGIKEFNGYLLGAYCDEKAPDSNKVITVNLFDAADVKLQRKSVPDNFMDIVEEGDYIELVKAVLAQPDEIYVRTTNYTGDMHRLMLHINILAYYFADWTDIYLVQAEDVEVDFQHRDEYTEILEKYWGHKSFRTLPVYDVNKLEDGEKKVVEISQENIISDLVQQVENCHVYQTDFRDVFVTAPTGAGKSAMFQIPAMYLAEKYNLFTIVISPLIALMDDQIKNLEVKNYKYSRTINSDISPIIKQDIIEKVGEGQCHILYMSPETLLSRSNVEQLIGDRTVGMIVIDEAHIVTTWGKQFRPDYWYLGDHIQKLRKSQLKKKGSAFVVATFTATAIYHGVEDMYTETINSLHMLTPITYLGYVKRNDINIVIDKLKKNESGHTEYEPEKFKAIQEVVQRAIITDKKTLIYFPTVALINRCYEYLRVQKLASKVTIYHGQLDKDKKNENAEMFGSKERLVMLATKAFGMGIDIDDIEIVAHFAPTGNVCDYVQEIGRAARRNGLEGEAYYRYNPRDFKHINRLHGLSTIQKYQLIEVIKKIDELYADNLKKGARKDFTRKRNAMLLDAENFSYIFNSPFCDDDENLNKVKTALLIIQKDFERKMGFSPVTIRPIPLFSWGFFSIEPKVQNAILKKYPNSLEEIEKSKHICRVNLSKIWDENTSSVSFPQFKYQVYSNDTESEFVRKYKMLPALCVSVTFENDYKSVFDNVWLALRAFINKKVISSEHVSKGELINVLINECSMNKYKAQSVCEVVLASMDSYRKNFSKTMQAIMKEKVSTDGTVKYQFEVAVGSYFSWVESGFSKVISNVVDGEMYLVNENNNRAKEISVILGILEAVDVLSFKMIGGANSQLYIYINNIQALKNIISRPGGYDNLLLDSVADRHLISVKMLTYLYEGDFSSSEIWELIENYFLGNIPEKVKQECLTQNPDIKIE